ncbi:MAG: hypothetical protein K2P76_08000 [Lachnospiraceae bacterium]|nr:hypothetical protein [Lachnospiraceae bacterium]
MAKLLEKIFDEIITYEKDFIIMDAGIGREIEKRIRVYQKAMNEEEIEELKNLLYEMTKISEREGFFLGIKYAFRIFSGEKFS